MLRRRGCGRAGGARGGVSPPRQRSNRLPRRGAARPVVRSASRGGLIRLRDRARNRPSSVTNPVPAAAEPTAGSAESTAAAPRSPSTTPAGTADLGLQPDRKPRTTASLTPRGRPNRSPGTSPAAGLVGLVKIEPGSSTPVTLWCTTPHRSLRGTGSTSWRARSSPCRSPRRAASIRSTDGIARGDSSATTAFSSTASIRPTVATSTRSTSPISTSGHCHPDEVHSTGLDGTALSTERRMVSTDFDTVKVSSTPRAAGTGSGLERSHPVGSSSPADGEPDYRVRQGSDGLVHRAGRQLPP